MDCVVETEGLVKTYPNGFTAVSDLALKVPRGIFGFLGPNGAVVFLFGPSSPKSMMPTNHL